MIIVLVTMILDYLIYSILIGISYYVLKTSFNWDISKKALLFTFFILFALLDMLYLPAFFVIDATITIHNRSVADLLSLYPDYPLIKLYEFGWFEIGTYLIQSFIALFVAEKLQGVNESKVHNQSLERDRS